MINRRELLSGAAAGLIVSSAALLTDQPARAETFKLTAIGGPPPVALSVKVTKEFFLPEINKRLAASNIPHRIEWTEAWSGSVAKLPEVFAAVENGVGDLGVQVWPFEGSEIAVGKHDLPRPLRDIRSAAIGRDFSQVAYRKIPEMDAIFQKYNQVHLASWALDPDHLASRVPIRQFEDLKGRKIGATGTMAQYFANTGAVPVSSSMDQAVTAIESGVYEGYPAPITLMFPYRMHNSAKFVTEVNFGSTVASGISPSTRRPGIGCQTKCRRSSGKWHGKLPFCTADKRLPFRAISAREWRAKASSSSDFPQKTANAGRHRCPTLRRPGRNVSTRKAFPARSYSTLI